MRHLIVCCDGTWNSAAQKHDGVPTPTNVRLFHNALAAKDARGDEQVVRYFSGVGADGSALARAFDGGTGHGLSANIRNAYLWLATTYRDGDDRIAAVGFSRGAFTARSLIGMITRCGLLDFGDRERWGNPQARQDAVARVFEKGYAHHGSDEPSRGWDERLDFHPGFAPGSRAERGSRIEFVGVWDTVGALGIPDSLALLDVFDRPDRWRFHDTTLADEVGFARHALALDERRGAFRPTPWTLGPEDPRLPPNTRRLRQLWFPGVHSDVGGGYPDSGLSDGALRWMMDEAHDTVGLRFRPGALAELRPCATAVLHESCVGPYERMSSAPRAVPRVDRDASVHGSATQRSALSPVRQDPYRRTEVPVAGEPRTVEVLAREPWSDTGLFLEAGTYDFTADGDWVDRGVPAGPDGVSDLPGRQNLFQVGATLLGRIEDAWHELRGGDAAQFVATKRWEKADWMELVGVVAHGNGTPERADGRSVKGPDGHQYLRIGRELTGVEVPAAGYLYAFANDAWGMYDNNRGSVRLTVSRRATCDEPGDLAPVSQDPVATRCGGAGATR